MDFHPDLQRELMKSRMEEQRRSIQRERLARNSRQNRSPRVSLKARFARTLFRTALAVDAGEVWREFWKQLAGGKATGGRSASG